MLNDKHFTKDAYEDNGRFQIHPLNSEGLEAYLSKESYNYHYLKSKYDPILLKQIEEEVNEEKQKRQVNQNVIKDEKEKKEDIKEQKIEKVDNNKNIKNPQIKKNEQTKKENKTIGNKQLNQKNNNKNKSNVQKSSTTQKINNIGKSMNPVIINVNNDRGKLEDFQQPYHA
jgi:hypothetical protein